MTTLTSRNGTLEFGPGRPTMLINDQLRVMDQSPEVLAELKTGKIDKLLELARFGQQIGTHCVDILVVHRDLDEVELLPRVAHAVHEAIGCPISIDTLKTLSDEMGLTTVLGIGNAGHGMPTQTVIDLAYLIAAVPWGLHAALVDPKTEGLVDTVLAVDFLTNRDPYGARYIKNLSNQEKNE